MSADGDRIRRELGMGMPTPARDLATERYSVTTKSFVKPEIKQLTFQVVLGDWMVNDGSGWRKATREEIEQFTGIAGYRHPKDADLLCGIVLGAYRNGIAAVKNGVLIRNEDFYKLPDSEGGETD